MPNHYKNAREYLSFSGNRETSLQNLLAILIGPKADPKVTGELADMGVSLLNEMSINDFTKFSGVGEMGASRLFAAFGVAFQLKKSSGTMNKALKSTTEIADYFTYLEEFQQECFEVLFLNTRRVVLGRRNIFKGSLDSILIHPREIFKEAIKLSAASIVVAHNHPTGNPTPSREDIDVTKRLKEVGLTIGIELLDHVIIGANGKFVSLKEKGYV
jgi:DNA repair protein RadC